MIESVSYMDDDAWLSLVERYVRDVEVAGSNPVASTKKGVDYSNQCLFCCNYGQKITAKKYSTIHSKCVKKRRKYET